MKLFAYADKPNILRTSIFTTLQQLHWFENRSDIVVFVAEHCAYGNDVSIEYYHSSMTQRIQRISLVSNMPIDQIRKQSLKYHMYYDQVHEWEGLLFSKHEESGEEEDVDENENEHSEAFNLAHRFRVKPSILKYIDDLENTWLIPLLEQYGRLAHTKEQDKLIDNYSPLDIGIAKSDVYVAKFEKVQ